MRGLERDQGLRHERKAQGLQPMGGRGKIERREEVQGRQDEHQAGDVAHQGQQREYIERRHGNGDHGPVDQQALQGAGVVQEGEDGGHGRGDPDGKNALGPAGPDHEQTGEDGGDGHAKARKCRHRVVSVQGAHGRGHGGARSVAREDPAGQSLHLVPLVQEFVEPLDQAVGQGFLPRIGPAGLPDQIASLGLQRSRGGRALSLRGRGRDRLLKPVPNLADMVQQLGRERSEGAQRRQPVVDGRHQREHARKPLFHGPELAHAARRCGEIEAQVGAQEMKFPQVLGEAAASRLLLGRGLAERTGNPGLRVGQDAAQLAAGQRGHAAGKHQAVHDRGAGRPDRDLFGAQDHHLEGLGGGGRQRQADQRHGVAGEHVGIALRAAPQQRQVHAQHDPCAQEQHQQLGRAREPGDHQQRHRAAAEAAQQAVDRPGRDGAGDGRHWLADDEDGERGPAGIGHVQGGANQQGG